MDKTTAYTETSLRLDRLDRMADRLDKQFEVMGIRFGWDSILGLIPGVGDAVTTVPAAYMILEGARMGARKRVLARMGANSAIDFVIGGVPVLGDAFDVLFKANRRNIALLRREIEAREAQDLSSDRATEAAYGQNADRHRHVDSRR